MMVVLRGSTEPVKPGFRNESTGKPLRRVEISVSGRFATKSFRYRSFRYNLRSFRYNLKSFRYTHEVVSLQLLSQFATSMNLKY